MCKILKKETCHTKGEEGKEMENGGGEKTGGSPQARAQEAREGRT